MGNCASRPSKFGKRFRRERDYELPKPSKEEKKSMYLLAKPTEYNEIERLNMQHFIFKVVFGGVHINEVNFLSKGGEVLDICSGSGIWCVDMAKTFPKANITGMDISPAKPMDSIPPNVKLIAGNAAEKLPFPDNHFDYVHMRLVLYVFKQVEWIPVLKEVHRILKKGGYFEILESEATIGEAGECGIFTNKLQNTMAARGQDPKLTENLPLYLQAANFKQLKSDCKSIPLGWGNRIGEAMLEDVIAALTGARSNFSKIFGFTSEQYDAHLERIRETMVNEKQLSTLWNYWGVKEDDAVDDNPTATTHTSPVEITTVGGDGAAMEWMDSIHNAEFENLVSTISHAGKRDKNVSEEFDEEPQDHDGEQQQHDEEQQQHDEE